MTREDESLPDLTKSEYLTYGGLAVVEGVMMRSPRFYSVACRAPNGNIVVKTEPLRSTWIGRQNWLKKPFLRGTLALLDTMVLGNKAMGWAGEVQLDPKHGAPVEAGKGPQTEKSAKTKAFENAAVVATVVVVFVAQFMFFKQMPEHIAEWIVRTATKSEAKNLLPLATNYIAEVIKVLLFVLFLAGISRMPSILEIFRYHGAEHKAINASEARQSLTIENVGAQTRLHPRCGTNFLIIVTILAFILVPAIPRDLIVPTTSPAWMLALARLPVNLVALPVLAGISYEIIRAAGKAKDAKWVNILLKPGLLTQLITTAEPAPKHLEVAIVALESVILAEESGELNVSDDFVSPVRDEMARLVDQAGPVPAAAQ